MVEAAVGFQCPSCVAEQNRDVRRARTLFGGEVSDDPAWVTKVLIGITAAAFVAQLVSDQVATRFFLVGLALDSATLTPVGVADGEYYRLLTSAFLHSGPLHLLLNMWALWLFGPQLESVLGRVRFVALYLVSALAGSAASYALSSPGQPSLGASGAVFGLLGAYVVVSRRLRRDTTPVLVLLAINLGYGFLVPRIDWKAHLGGLVAGALVTAVMAYAPRRHRGVVQAVGTLLVLGVVVVAVLARTLELRS